MKIAVTGGSGFLGRATIEAAKASGHYAWSFDRSGGNDIMGSLEGLRDADTVIHLAGVLGTSELFDTPELAVDINIKGTLRILEWCVEHDAGFVGILMPDVFPSVYTATKVAAHRLSEAWRTAYGIPVSHVRAFNVYGPHQAYGPGHPQKIVPTFARMSWERQPLPVWGGGTQTMDLVHVDDVARMLVDAVEYESGEIFDGGTGISVSVNEFAHFVNGITGSDAGVQYLPMRLGERPTRLAADGNGWELLGWRPKLDVDRLEETVWWYKNG